MLAVFRGGRGLGHESVVRFRAIVAFLIPTPLNKIRYSRTTTIYIFRSFYM